MVGKITVLRAQRELEMANDIELRTSVTNIDRDPDGTVTIYGKEIDGTLYFVTLDRDTVLTLMTLEEYAVTTA